MGKCHMFLLSLGTILNFLCCIAAESVQYSCTGENAVLLTFDDGPKGVSTMEILDTLKEFKIKALFFVCGVMLEEFHNVLVLKRIFDEGHVVGSHTYHHKNLTEMSREEVIEQMTKTSDAIEKIIGVQPRLVRVPFG